MNDQCTEKQIKKLCQSYSKQTEKEFKNYYDQDFLEWLEKTNPTELTKNKRVYTCLLYTSPSPRDGLLSRMPSSA